MTTHHHSPPLSTTHHSPALTSSHHLSTSSEEKYSFHHLHGAGLSRCPFFGLWVCGGFGVALRVRVVEEGEEGRATWGEEGVYMEGLSRMKRFLWLVKLNCRMIYA